ncbi:hypothetical protein EMN47_11695 [Prolixibacteraceae bacterium JC049]|nr:hypothetical protein [Prolixibacteraceae bacterium JC049]
MNSSKRDITTKKILFLCFVGLLLLPTLQKKLKLVNERPLKGVIEKQSNPYFTPANWFAGDYQTQQQDYLEYSIGFRTYLVRFYNQLYFSCLNQARANSVVIGKENYLYEENYIKAHLGRDFIGQKAINEKVSKLKRVCDTLKHKGTDLVVLLAPGKGSFYTEFIPDSYDPTNRTSTNYSTYAKALAENNINLLDFHQWFRQMKTTSPHPLFPKTGIHWSKYGEVLVADSLIKYINHLKGEQLIGQLTIDSIATSNQMRDTDDDIEQGMNILSNIEDLKMGYPFFHLDENKSNSPKVLTIADSYYWGMFNWGLSRKAFNNGQFWFYNEQIYPAKDGKPQLVKDIDIKTEVEKNSVILLIATDANLYRFAFGFIDQLYNAYIHPEKAKEKQLKEKQVQTYIHAIKTTPEWLELVKKKAKEEGISLDKAIRKNAEYMVWKDSQKK